MANEAMTSGKLYMRLLGYVKPYWRAFALALLAAWNAAAPMLST